MSDYRESDERTLLTAREKRLIGFAFANDRLRLLQSTRATKPFLRAWNSGGDSWGYVGRYLLFIIVCSLVWESLHMPLYTLWAEATVWGLAADVVACTGANMVIASASLLIAAVIVGKDTWQLRRPIKVALPVCGIAVGYTLFSEWLNVQVFRAWAYSSLMPLLPGTEIGVSPILQWIVTPAAALWWAHRSTACHQSPGGTISDN